jgi:hypothetical protein
MGKTADCASTGSSIANSISPHTMRRIIIHHPLVDFYSC